MKIDLSDHATRSARLSRRTFLKASGIALLLPNLECHAGAEQTEAPRRMVCVCNPLGFHAPNLIPTESGEDYQFTPYLEIIKDLKDEFTLISGLQHPEVDAGHDSIFSFLTAAPHPELRSGFRNSISLDQVAADHLRGTTRFDSLSLSSEGFGLSWTRSGALIPTEYSPSRLFAKLFIEGHPREVKSQIQRLKDGQSILDQLQDQARLIRSDLSKIDREKLEEYFTSIRELELQLKKSEEWTRKSKPKTTAQQPQDANNPADLIGKSKLLLDLTHLAFESDSTRIVTMLLLGSSLVPPIPGISDGHHNLSHHGQDPGKLDQLKIVELELMKTLGDFLRKLKTTSEGDSNLLDRTTVLIGSNLGNASSHSCKNLPMIVAGGGYPHGRHLAFDQGSSPPLSNLFVSMLQKMGMETEIFGSSTGTLKELETRT